MGREGVIQAGGQEEGRIVHVCENWCDGWRESPTEDKPSTGGEEVLR